MAPPERRRFQALFGRAGGETVPELRSLLEAHAADRLAAGAAEGFAEQAVELVAGCGLGDTSTGEFEELARYVANRQR